VKVRKTPAEIKANAPKPAKNATVDKTGIVKEEAQAKATAKPEASSAEKPVQPPAEPPAEEAGKKPRTMKAPRKAGADDLKMIKGVGPKLEELLHSLGFFHFDQVAKWSDEEVQWVDRNLEGFKGRVSRDNWVKQAKLLADGKETEFSAKAKKGGVY
jgi:NADH-quinone oxidoreductase subunit E